ncbi:MBL fold metallo-hydrolase [Bacillus timonensis]|uniref:MBL fold metallo-hydrolase n=1 Tax=Bacillus timonensis TaxID=1033734 RepID=A0A4S3Q0R0_9BACI|nr:MBL fold metallo-hydrolase [Bacillus timonensis]THE14982.1 MBL fold metallo-hydrolase [Bacillus timonensis]
MSKLTTTKDVFKITLPTPFSVGDVNVYVVKGDALTLIDAGAKTEEAWQSFKEQLAQLGYTPSDIEQIVITHHHPDHVGLLDYFSKDIPIIGHPKNQPWISQDQQFFAQNEPFYKELFTQLGLNPAFVALINMDEEFEYSCRRSLSSTIGEGDTLEGLPGFKVLETPGHAQSHIVLYREEDGMLIAGDTILAKISPNPLLEPPQFGETSRPRPLIQYNNSLRKLLTLDMSKVVTGHGDDITNAHHLIQERFISQKERAYHVLKMIEEKPMTAFEVCSRLFPKVYLRQPLFTISETVGQLDFLEELGEIKIEVVNGQHIYHSN